jgi:hypothetical protein
MIGHFIGKTQQIMEQALWQSGQDICVLIVL